MLASCGGSSHGANPDTGVASDAAPPLDACVGLQCQVTNCEAMGMSPTSISGTIFAPNGTLPLYEVNVYVPNGDPGAFTAGVQCSKCSDGLPGDPIAQTTSTESGSFELDDIPDGDNIPVVITIGKWRRQLVIPHVDKCTPTPLSAADTTLPKSRADLSPLTKSVDLPKIALSTGNADALECLLRKLGIADQEIATVGEDGQIDLYADGGAGNGEGAASFQAGFAGGSGAFADSSTLWGSAGDPGDLASYDIVMLSCEGAQHAESKPQEAMDHVKAYADAGGRVFMSHWHNVWLEGSTQNTKDGTQTPAAWPALATFDDKHGAQSLPDGTLDVIDETNNPKGSAFAQWMLDPAVQGSTTIDQIALGDGTGKQTCTTVDDSHVERWVNLDPAGSDAPQMIQFDTPTEQDPSARCGKVVFSDMHVSGDSGSPQGGTYPTKCSTGDLTPQEKALAFMFFDISSCVGVIQ
nr:hypothetical protein [Kofleriaceae bacterium]